jgi:hypothetical protein
MEMVMRRVAWRTSRDAETGFGILDSGRPDRKDGKMCKKESTVGNNKLLNIQSSVCVIGSFNLKSPVLLSQGGYL